MAIIRQYAGSQQQQQPMVFLTKWLGTVIARNHALMPKIQQIADDQLANDLTSFSIRGKPSSGKTELAKTIAHMLHIKLNRMARETTNSSDYLDKNRREIKRGYCIKILSASDMLKFEDVIEGLPHINRIILFDDVSFMTRNKMFTEAKKKMTEVRHLSKNESVKTVLGFNFHWSNTLDPYIRDTNFFFQTSVSSGERKNLDMLYGTSKENKNLLASYYNWYGKIKRHGQITLSTSGKGRKAKNLVTYKYSDPFRIGLFYDQEKLKVFVYPDSTKMGVQKCLVCNPQAEKPIGDVEEIMQWLQSRSGQSLDVMGQALRNECIRRYGHDPINNTGNQFAEMIRRLEANNIVTFSQLYDQYVTTRKHKKITFEQFQLLLKKRRNIPKKFRESFFLKFGMDGLKTVTEPMLDKSMIDDAKNEDLR